MRKRSEWLAVFGTPLAFALPFGVKWTALGLDEGSSSTRLWAGLPLLAAGILGVECLGWSVDLVRTELDRLRTGPDKARQILGPVCVLETAALVLLLVATVLQFALLLDGHVRLRACGWLLLAYAAGAAPVRATGRHGVWARYLRWSWAPLLAFGVPLGLPALLAAGLVTPAIPPS